MRKILILLFALLLSSCMMNYSVRSPYLISEKSVILNGNGTESKFASAVFVFTNLEEKQIAEINFCFYLYDQNGRPVGLGSNGVSSSYAGGIAKNASVKLEIPVDFLLGSQMPVGMQIGNVFVTQIKYADGTVWNDCFGFYSE